MLSHVSLGTRDLERSRSFYAAVLSQLGYVEVWCSEKAAGFGPPGGDDALALFARSEEGPLAAGPGFHVAFSAPSREAVDAFYAAALARGGSDGGAPALRLRYGPTYYAAFVFDPDGHKLEAVHQQPARRREGGER